MISLLHLLEQACSPEGLDITQTVEDFLHGLELGCYLCQEIREFSENYQDSRFSNSFYHIEKNKPLFKNVRCRKIDRQGNPYEIPRNFRFDEMEIKLGSPNAAEEVMLDVQAFDGDPAAYWVSARPYDPNINRAEAIESAKQWLSDCVNCHEQCSIPSKSANGARTTPKRLLKIRIEISGCTKVNLHLCEQNENPRYTALSYCWGTGQAYKLTISNLEAMYVDVPIPSLAQTIQDAISVASRMGIQYLWIDSLCIIQDSATDKDDEISAMDHIYRNAEFTICAASSRACTEGFLQKRIFSGPSMPEVDYSTLQFPCPNGARGTILVKHIQSHDVNDQPLNKRGWTLQEHMLSSRVLVYDSWQVWWECLEGKRCDKGNPDIISYRGMQIDRLPIHGQMGRIKRMSCDSDHDPDFLWKTWAEVVEAYTDRDLSIESDRLPALSGLATKFSNLWGCAYYAGLWEKKLIEGLRWAVLDPSTSVVNASYAPSWSWAFITGAVSWYAKSSDDTPVVENPVQYTSLVECKATPANEAVPFGQVTDWSLTIEGSAQWIDWDGQEQIEAKGLDTDSRPLKSLAIGSQLFPEGIIALARPDCSQLQVFGKESKRDPSSLPRDDEEEKDEDIFYMGGEAAETNEITLEILAMVISRESALMLYPLKDDQYFRIGLLEFREEEDLKAYFEGCDIEKVTVF
ncbi:MAG: hypothetical protein Q9225_000294 [Loekoesia sp. 1 TL-2023]